MKCKPTRTEKKVTLEEAARQLRQKLPNEWPNFDSLLMIINWIYYQFKMDILLMIFRALSPFYLIMILLLLVPI